MGSSVSPQWVRLFQAEEMGVEAWRSGCLEKTTTYFDGPRT